MLIEQTLDKMNAMKLAGMADALKQQVGSAQHVRLSFDERLGPSPLVRNGPLLLVGNGPGHCGDCAGGVSEASSSAP
jgi:hypothetical protein